MQFQNYVEEKKQFYDILLEYIESETNNEDDFQPLKDILETKNIGGSRDELEDVLHLLLKLSKNHFRQPTLFSKIEQILTFFTEDIKQTFTNSELFDFFKLNKKILLFLFTNNIITIDQSIVDFIVSKANLKRRLFFINRNPTKEFLEERKRKINDLKYADYYHYFYPEIESFINEDKRTEINCELTKIDSQIFDNFDEKRKIGENDSYICSLIRNDSVEEFITYITKTNISISSIIQPSIFETNPLIIRKVPTLIEYAAFFGSIQIFQYLQLNKVDVKPSIWLYAIHGRNAELIHLLEEYQIEPEDKTYEKCLKEAIKCHHNDIANYIQNNLLNEKAESKNIEENFSKNILSYSFHYYNYPYFPNEFNNKFIFYYTCLYDYFKLLFIILQENQVDINEKVKISTFVFF